jgi:hypothetical protein
LIELKATGADKILTREIKENKENRENKQNREKR